MTWDEAFDANYTDGIIVLHAGKVVYERYDGCLSDDAGIHGAMSVTKSVTGLLAETLVAEGKLDEDAQVTSIIPELKGSAYDGTTVRNVLNMTTALDYSEDYSDPNAGVWTYGAASSGLPKPDDYDGPVGIFEYLTTLKATGKPGEAFDYQTPNADAAGWIVSRITGKSVSDLLSERIWSRIGTEREAYYMVDSQGIPSAGGGFNAALGDMARLGQLMLDKGRVNGEQIVPAEAVERIAAGGDPAVFAKADYPLLKGWSYHGLWWHTDHAAYAARGVYGQTIYVDPDADMVIARFASYPVAANHANDPTSLPAYQAVADYLKSQDVGAFAGSHGDTAALMGDEWVIEDIGGRGVIDSSHASLQFLPDGRLAGSGGCNRLIGSYTQDGGNLSVEPAGTTMMACPEALMEQESRLLGLLPSVSGYRIDGTGALILTTADGGEITARRD